MNYSLLFYPLAALLHPLTVVSASCAGAAAGFAALLRRRWPAIATVPSLAFALLVPLGVLAGTYPFVLGLAFAIGALAALDAGRRRLAFAAVVATALAHPLALAFLLMVLTSVAVSARGWWRTRAARVLAVGVAGIAAAQALLLRGFSSAGQTYPFDPKDALAIAGFCVAGLLLTRGLADQRPLRAVFLGYAALGGVAFAISSPLGGNAVRLILLMGVPLLLLPLAARGFRPRGVTVACVALAFMWQALPAVANWDTAADSRGQHASFWRPVTTFLANHPEPDYRVEVVATAEHWEAYYLARRGVPLARGWFRQDDFPANAVLYGTLTARTLRPLATAHRGPLRLPARRAARLQLDQRGEAAALGGVRPARGGAHRRVDHLRAAGPHPDRHPGRRRLRAVAHLGRGDPPRGPAGDLSPSPALHAVLERGGGHGLRGAARALGHRPARDGPRHRAADLRPAPRHLRGRRPGQPGRLRPLRGRSRLGARSPCGAGPVTQGGPTLGAQRGPPRDQSRAALTRMAPAQ